MDKYVLTVFPNDRHADTACPMDGKILGRFNSREKAERLLERVNPTIQFHTVELTAIVEGP